MGYYKQGNLMLNNLGRQLWVCDHKTISKTTLWTDNTCVSAYSQQMTSVLH